MTQFSKKEEKIILRDYQKSLVNDILKLHSEGEKGILNITRTGLGKSYMSLATAKRLKLPVFIVCPGMVINKWTKLCLDYDIYYYEIISYQSLAGVSKKLNHPWLQRIDNTTTSTNGRSTTITNYTVTNEFIKVAEKGVYLIIDEVQTVKNPNATSRACIRLANAVFKSNTSYLIGLSASPFDDESNAVTIMKLLGCIDDSQRLYHKYGEKIVCEGLESLFVKCETIDEKLTKEIRALEINSKSIKNICYRLYNIVKQRIALGVNNVQESITNNVKATMRNVFYNINESFIKQLQDAINGLVQATKYENGNIYKEKGRVLGDIIRNLVQIEKAKSYDMAIRTHQILQENENNKVILCMNYNESIDLLNYYLQIYNPLIINGNVDSNTREQYLYNFNQADNNYRLLLMNTKCGGTGIDLHDMHGDFPRTMIISPCYSILSLIQAAGRTFREGVKSNVDIIIFYGNGNLKLEMNILEALARKSDYVRGSLPTANNDGTYPGEYPCYKETVDGKLIETENPIHLENNKVVKDITISTNVNSISKKMKNLAISNDLLKSYNTVPSGISNYNNNSVIPKKSTPKNYSTKDLSFFSKKIK